MRARRLEAEKQSLENEKTTMQHLFEKTLKGEDEAAMTIGRLQVQKEILKQELQKKDKGLSLWKKKEHDYQTQLSQMKDRMEEMSGMIRLRENDFEKLKERNSKQKEKEHVNTKVAVLSKRKNHDRSNTDPTGRQFPPIRQAQGLKTLPHNAKLPSLVAPPRLPPEGASGEDNIPKKSRPKALIDVSSIPNSKLPPLIQSKKLPSPRGGNKSLLSELEATKTATEMVKAEGTVKAVMGEKWIDRNGGEIDIGKIALHIPPNSVSNPVLITITETDHKEARSLQIKQAGLAPYMVPGIQVRLQPHGQKFLRPIYMQMKGAKVNGPGKLLIFHKEVDVHNDSEWNDVTEDVKPTVRKEDVIISIDRFSIIETMRLLVPVVSLAAGMAIGYNISLLRTHARALLNEQKEACEFHIFHRDKDPFLQVICVGQQVHNNNNTINERISQLSGYRYLGNQSSRFELCDSERLFFFFDRNPEIAASFIFNVEEAKSGGQRFQIPLGKQKSRGVVFPETLIVKRRVAEQLDDVTLCEAHLSQKTSAGGLDEPDGAESEQQWEEVFRSNRVALVKTIDVRDILDYLIQCKIISIDEQDEIKSHRTRRERVEALIDKLHMKGSRGFDVFVKALSEDYEDLSKSLQKGLSIEAT